MSSDLSGAIVMLEEVDLRAIDFDVMFWQMRLAGMFDNVAGFVVSDLHGCGQPDPEVVADRSLEDVLEQHLGSLGVPVIYGLPLGHGPHLASIPFGVMATLDADAAHADDRRARRSLSADSRRRRLLR